MTRIWVEPGLLPWHLTVDGGLLGVAVTFEDAVAMGDRHGGIVFVRHEATAEEWRGQAGDWVRLRAPVESAAGGQSPSQICQKTPREVALTYVAAGKSIFPCHWRGERRKQPLIKYGFRAASSDRSAIEEWWDRWPAALIGLPTGPINGAVVLDIDVKIADANGLDTLAALGFAVLPETPTVNTASGGLHLYFAIPADKEIRNTGGARGRGIGPGLDWRGEGGYVIAPSPGSGYTWASRAALAEIPTALLPREAESERSVSGGPVKPETGLSRYAEAALDHACRNILGAPAGEQETTLNGEAYAIGTLAGAGAIPAEFARQALQWAARQIPNYDPRRPWLPAEIDRKIDRAFANGQRHPRGPAHG